MIKRIETDKRSLQNGNSIASTAGLSGFVDQSHLNKRFKAITGITKGEDTKSSLISKLF